MKKILLIEDDRALNTGICLALQGGGIHVEQCFDLRSARTKYKSDSYDLVILDLNLPDGSGLDYLQELRLSEAVPLIVLTVNDLETDIVAGLEMGADDYVTKPFSLAVLRARVNAQLRKGDTAQSERIQVGEFMFDFVHMEYFKNGVPVELSKTEQKLLKCLVQNRGLRLSRSDLVDRVWTDGAEFVEENALSVTIKRLRDKLEKDSARPQYIKTVYGFGYTWAEPGQ